jgi:hypothetical protein
MELSILGDFDASDLSDFSEEIVTSINSIDGADVTTQDVIVRAHKNEPSALSLLVNLSQADATTKLIKLLSGFASQYRQKKISIATTGSTAEAEQVEKTCRLSNIKNEAPASVDETELIRSTLLHMVKDKDIGFESAALILKNCNDYFSTRKPKHKRFLKAVLDCVDKKITVEEMIEINKTTGFFADRRHKKSKEYKTYRRSKEYKDDRTRGRSKGSPSYDPATAMLKKKLIYAIGYQAVSAGVWALTGIKP